MPRIHETQPALTEAVYFILLSLLEPLHGYGIMQNAEHLSGGRVRLAAGTLYGALNTLLERGWIAALPGRAGENNRGKKEYRITPEGKAVLEQEILRLSALAEIGGNVLREKGELTCGQ